MTAIRTFKLEGLVTATFTPMKADGEIDYDKFDQYCQHLYDNGLTQIYVNGTTGEGPSLTLDERKKIVEKWMEVGKKSGRITAIVVHVGALNLHDTVELAKHAKSAGADAFATVAPLFFKPKTVELLVKYCKEVANAAPELPFYFYHIPPMTGVDLNMEQFLTLGAKEIPNLIGVKFSSKDLVDMLGCLNIPATNRDDKTFNMMYGCDEQILAGMITGAQSGVGSTYQLLAPVVHKLLDNIAKGNIVEARVNQYYVQQTCVVMYKYGDILGHNVASLKAIMAIIGVDLGPPRPIMRAPTELESAQYKKDLENIGYFEWNKK